MDVKRLRPAALLGVLAYSFAVMLPAIATIAGDQELLKNGLVDCTARIFGIVAYSIICFQFVLAGRISWIVKTFSFPKVIRFHKTMAVLAAHFVLVHIALLVYSRANWGLVLNPWAGWPIQLGRAAVILLVILLAISFGRKWLPIHDADWRWFHSSLAWLILILGFVHSIVIGSSFKDATLASIWTAYFAIAMLVWGWSRLNPIETTNS